MTRMTSTRVNKWLTERGFFVETKEQTIVNKTVYKPMQNAAKIGILEEENVDPVTGEVKKQIVLDEKAQLFIIENLIEIAQKTS